MKDEKKQNNWTKWLYWFLFAVAIVVVYKTLDNFSEIIDWFQRLISLLMPFLMGILLAYLFYLPCRKIESWYKKTKIKMICKKARVLSVITVYIIACILLILAINVILPALAQSAMDLLNNLQGYYGMAMQKINEMPQDSIWHKINATEIIQKLQGTDFTKYFNIEQLAQYAKGVIDLATSVFDIFVSLVVSVYILVERKEILEFLKKLTKAVFSKKTYQGISKYFNKTNEIFFRYLLSQLLDAFVVGVLVSIAMSILDVKYAVLLGVLIGVSNLIPYFGAIVGVGISIIITIFTGGIGQAIWMAIIVIILQQIDANIINPHITGNSLKISPLLVIFAVTIGGAYFGVLGMFLAVPIMTVLKLLLLDYIDYHNQLKEEKKII